MYMFPSKFRALENSAFFEFDGSYCHQCQSFYVLSVPTLSPTYLIVSNLTFETIESIMQFASFVKTIKLELITTSMKFYLPPLRILCNIDA